MDRFIVGTGRCGSTLLSRMLGEHPGSLSIFEYFNGLEASRRFESRPFSGADFAALISAEQPFLTAVLRRGYPVEEVIYPFGRGRYRRDGPLPYLLGGMFPRLSDDPDALFDSAVAHARSLPSQPAAAHHRALFDWLAERLGKSFWIERAGSSVEYLGSLHQLFPAARFLHLHRDGPEVALSMREHHAYRLPVAVLYRTPIDGVPFAELPLLDLHAPPRPDDTVSRILASRPPAEYFGTYWTDQLERGLVAAASLGPDQYLDVRFEDLVAHPDATLRRICDFFELDRDGSDGGDWVARAAALVRGVPPTRADGLPADERERLVAACRSGRALVGRS